MDTLEIKHLTTGELDSTSLSAKNIYTVDDSGKAVNITSALSQLDHIPEDVIIPISINGITADANGNIQVPKPPEPIDQSYTAFAVYPTSADIEAGTIHEYFGEVLETIPAGNIHVMGIRSRIKPAIPVSVELSNATAADWVVPDPDNIDISVDYNIDISVDWGDGTISPLAACCKPLPDLSAYRSDCQFATQSIRQPSSKKEEYTYLVWHKYDDKDLNKEHIVKILGDDWFGVSLDYEDLIKAGCSKYCLVSRFLDKDLPMKNTIETLAYFCSGSYRLTSINVPGNMDLTAVNHLFRAFSYCKNLKTVKGLSEAFKILKDSNYMFAESNNLKVCDLKLPSLFTDDIKSNAFAGVFSNCVNLEGYIEDFLPSTTVNLSGISVSGIFYNCKNLQVVDINKVAKVFWNAPDEMKPNSYSAVFKTCNDAVRAYIPTTWGGELEGDYRTLAERIVDLEKRVAALEAQAQ